MSLIKLEGFDTAVQRHTYEGDPLPVLYTGPRPCNRDHRHVYGHAHRKADDHYPDKCKELP